MTPAATAAPGALALKVGELVEVRSAEEIHATLDENGELDGLPFMPEMLAFCGRRLTVHKVAHKLCDYIGHTGLRRMSEAVHLTESRCDGSAHGGCENACSIYWKEQWLKRVSADDPVTPTPDAGQRVLLPLLVRNSQKEPFDDGAVRWSCQGTEMQRAAPEALPLKHLGQYREDVVSGNAGVLQVLSAFLIAVFNRYQNLSKKLLPDFLLIRDGLHWGFLEGGVRSGRTPTEILDLQPGELVRIKSREEIMATLDSNLLNRGMGFDAEMSRFCGRTARVKARATRCVDERSGRMLTMKNPCIILEDIVCEGAFTANCPRQYVCWWREIWLERIG
ncbi:hypothetical protein GON03_07805 [Nocardioides sp. MAH-18]|uniref:Uncharacterized protein n=1 Tax=Nocardioides agri TaxID=2682843 RepID=A0A6L6XQQ7_9ACTN|nr:MULTISPECIES: hypothetical protein [unclassified Nocardioides]MBA2954222.1 hypothetical protein [Nocardioides sp. CGMCC 1.13656]MVQ49083.1 hypothetical protein [Nocardioides sp. MAH-18]